MSAPEGEGDEGGSELHKQNKWLCQRMCWICHSLIQTRRCFIVQLLEEVFSPEFAKLVRLFFSFSWGAKGIKPSFFLLNPSLDIRQAVLD